MYNLKCNCCDGIYNSFDVHFTSCCDNKCKHCIDNAYSGLNIKKPNAGAIAKTIIDNKDCYEDVLFLGGEPCLYLDELLKCIKLIQANTNLKVFVTTSVPYICYKEKDKFLKLIDILDGINLSVQHYKEDIADEIRQTKSLYDRQTFYASLPKDKIRINLNIVKPFLYTKNDIIECCKHYDDMGFKEIKLSEIQHGKDYFVSFEKEFGIKLGSPYSHGCQKWIDMKQWIPDYKGKLLLKRSCFLCETTLKASFADGIKVLDKYFNHKQRNNYSVIYENGEKFKGWI